MILPGSRIGCDGCQAPEECWYPEMEVPQQNPLSTQSDVDSEQQDVAVVAADFRKGLDYMCALHLADSRAELVDVVAVVVVVD